MRRIKLGRHIVSDPAICHGKPTFTGTRIMVQQVLEMVAEGIAWEQIVAEYEGAISREAIAEAVRDLSYWQAGKRKQVISWPR